MNNRNITKVKVVAGVLHITYDDIHESEETGATINKVTIEGGHNAHQDFHDAMNRLNVHAAIICEQIKPAKKAKQSQTTVSEGGALITIPAKFDEGDMGILDRITCYALSIGGDDEKPGVVLSMKRRLESGKVLIINTPFTEYGQENGYKYRNKLAEDIEIVCQEALLYLDGKYAPSPQLQLFEDQE